MEYPAPPPPPSVGSHALAQSELTMRHKNLVKHLQASRGKRSLIAPAYFSLSCFGKLIFGFGASLAVKGTVNKDTISVAVGAALCGAGFICIVIVAFGFGAACSKIDKRRGILFKCASVSSAVLIAGGYALNQYWVSTHRSLVDIRLSFLPLFVGGSLLVVSSANFTAYTELSKGITPFMSMERRPLVAISMLAPGLGIMFGGWITGEKGEWPTAFNAVVLTFAMGCLYGGTALFWSDHLRREAEWAEACLVIQDYKTKHNTSPYVDFKGPPFPPVFV
ncbi:hypothetical protein VP01_3392g1 [Puccinia sorghi]|uniref:Uncharacterized protein n=1 Tax=Puccinia sorghi TaxID=27349 RepID=A0A0L6UYK8_9BASI|nr:hypothetical protein VP01_3392g1 [Puccinia sorghi]